MLMRVRILAVFALTLTALPLDARADRAAEIARIHIAAIGGRERIAALQAYRATGRVLTGDQSIGLAVIAARPMRLRVELQYADGLLIQATDGKNPPWQLDASAKPARCALLGPTAAADIAAEAEFDDPLVGAEAYGCAIDFAGEVQVGGERLFRLLVTQRLTTTFYLLVDANTYFIVQRIDEDRVSGATLTRYADFRPVAGVLWPHVITVTVNHGAPRQARFDRIEANPELRDDLFMRPE